MGQYLTFVLFRILVFPLSALPSSLLFGLSGFVKFILQDVLKYRKKVIESNIERALPQLSSLERKKIAQDFYSHLSQLFIESLKCFNISKKELLDRMLIVNPEVLLPFYEKNQSVILVTGHYANWELGVIIGPTFISQKSIGFYKRIQNPLIDKAVYESRERHGMQLKSLKETASAFHQTEIEKNEATAYFMVADQSPTNLDQAVWTDFMGIDTACIHGPEKYARKYKLPVFYIHLERLSKGHYQCALDEICPDPDQLEEGEITKKFMAKLEANIMENPANWLWSHRRWKHQRNP